MKIERFEDIQAWQEARGLANRVYDATDTGAFARDFALRDQIRDAAGSVMHNIAEGFEAGSDAEFMRAGKPRPYSVQPVRFNPSCILRLTASIWPPTHFSQSTTKPLASRNSSTPLSAI